ncbi:MAG: DNA repair protein RecN [Clostridia bacterium]|nr:DNA repair protein RecN [Clostridia bacterium]
MIQGLHIENIAVVKSLDIDFSGGFSVLTGETGAGKSIIIDSLNLLGGGRADRELIRRGETSAIVEAVFCDLRNDVIALLSELGFEADDGEVSLMRRIEADGKSSAKVNGRSVTLATLREIASAIFNIHGQNDNQQMMNAKNHVRILDKFAKNGDILAEYGLLYKEILHLRMQIESISSDTMEKNRLREMLSFQIEDIDSASLREGEEEKLLEEEKKLLSLERVNKCISLVKRAINGSEKGAGASYMCDRAANALSQISDAFPEASELYERLSSIKYELDDIAESAEALSDVGDEDPTKRLDKIGSRLEVIGKLKRKYGQSVEDILAFRADAARRLDEIDNSDVLIEELTKKLKDKEVEARRVAAELSSRRKNAAGHLNKEVTESLSFLDMPKVRFEVAIDESDDFTASGLDRVEFLIATNAGEPLMPMIKIASGGELSRIMLSLRSVMGDSDGMQTVIFDEIDTGISGKTSRKVGIKLRSISRSAQVICVTHSAQIASLADTHFFISKAERDGRVETSVKLLSPDERVEEIARILGGINITEAQRTAAREMIEEETEEF